MAIIAEISVLNIWRGFFWYVSALGYIMQLKRSVYNEIFFHENFLKKNCAIINWKFSNCYCCNYFNLLQTVGIPMGIDPAIFWANAYLYNYESKYITGLIKKD